jgi:hypothetical protein
MQVQATSCMVLHGAAAGVIVIYANTAAASLYAAAAAGTAAGPAAGAAAGVLPIKRSRTCSGQQSRVTGPVGGNGCAYIFVA